MDSSKVQITVNAQGEGSKIQIEEKQRKVQIQQKNSFPPSQQLKPELLMKLYVYGSCQSDQFRHPGKLSQSKRPICITNIQKFDLNDDQDDDSQQERATKNNIYPNPLFRKSVYKIACGGLHSVVLTTDGKAFTFGCNDEGALGRKGPQCIPIQVVLDNPVDLVSAGDNHTMFANSTNGIVYFTGNYNYLRGQKMVESINQPIKFTTDSLDVRNKNLSIQKIVSGANHTCILINNRIFCRGQPESFTTGRRINQRRKTQSSLTFDGVGLNNVLDVWCGGYHTVAKVKKGKDFVYHTWGKNDQGQLGIGNFVSQGYPVQIKSLRGKNIVKAAAGSFFTLFLTQNGQILGCGINEYGQLGLGEDYQFIPSQPQSEDDQSLQKQEQLKQHVQNLRIDQASKKIEYNNQNAQKIEIEAQNNIDSAIIGGPGTYQNQMISESQEKLVKKLPNFGTNQIGNSISGGFVQQNLNINGENNSQKKKFEQKNIYIKSVRPIVFPEQVTPKTPISNIAAGSQFSFSWNHLTELYSWGFGMNYVLLTGEQNQQYQPFKVRNKIINDQIISEIQAGGQHVLYTAYEKSQTKFKPNTQLQQRVTALLGGEKNKLKRKRKN